MENKEETAKYVDGTKIWNSKMDVLEQFYDENGHIIALKGLRYNGVHLWRWITKQRENHRNLRLSKNAIDRFERMQIIWDPKTKEGIKQKEQLLASLGIKELKIVDGKQVNIMIDDNKKDEPSDQIPEEQKNIEPKLPDDQPFVTIEYLRQESAKKEEENNLLKREIEEYQEFIKRYRALLDEKEKLILEKQKAEETLYSLLEEANVQTKELQKHI